MGQAIALFLPGSALWSQQTAVEMLLPADPLKAQAALSAVQASLEEDGLEDAAKSLKKLVAGQRNAIPRDRWVQAIWRITYPGKVSIFSGLSRGEEKSGPDVSRGGSHSASARRDTRDLSASNQLYFLAQPPVPFKIRSDISEVKEKAVSFYHQADVEISEGRWVRARTFLETSVILWVQIGYFKTAGNIKIRIGKINLAMERPVEAALAFARAQDFYERVASPSGRQIQEAAAQRLAAIRKAAESEPEERVFARLARRHRAAGEKRWEMETRYSRAVLLEDASYWMEAAREYGRVAASCWGAGQYGNSGLAYVKQAHALKHAGAGTDTMVRSLRRAARSFEEADDAEETTVIYGVILQELKEAERWDAMMPFFSKLESVHLARRDLTKARLVQRERTFVLERAGKVEEALRLWRRLAEAEERRGDTFSTATTYLLMGRLLRRMGRMGEAGKIFYAAGHYLFRRGRIHLAVGALGQSSLAYREAGMGEKADRIWREAREKAAPLDWSPTPDVVVYAATGLQLVDTEDYAMARDVLAKAVQIGTKTGGSILHFLLEKLGDMAAQTGDLCWAREAYRRAMALYQAEPDEESKARVFASLQALQNLH